MEDLVLTIPYELARAAQIDEKYAKIELATALYRDKKLSLGSARRLAGIDYADFYRELGAREIDLHYTAEDYDADIKTARDLGLIK